MTSSPAPPTPTAAPDGQPVPVNVQAARLLEMAQRCADTVIAEARETADRLLAEAGARAAAVEDAGRERAEALERAGHEQEERLRDRIGRLEGAEAEVRERVAALTARLAGVLDEPQEVAGPAGETTDEEAPVSVYEQLGRERGIGAAVELFYERVVADPQLAPYFAGTDMVTLRRHQTALLVQVTGGPVQYEGRDLARAHAGLGIAPDDFDRVVTHLAATLTDLGVADAVVEQVGAALGSHRAEIVQGAHAG
jgi:hemoglobin